MSACASSRLPRGGPCRKGEREQRGNSISWPQTREAPAAFPPLLVSIYRWVNLLTDVPAWRTSTSSLRYLMVAPSAQHGYARHTCSHRVEPHTKPESVEHASVYWPLNTTRAIQWDQIEKWLKSFIKFISLLFLLLCVSSFGSLETPVAPAHTGQVQEITFFGMIMILKPGMLNALLPLVDHDVVAMAAAQSFRAAPNINVTFTKTDFFCHSHAEIVTLRINVRGFFFVGQICHPSAG